MALVSILLWLAFTSIFAIFLFFYFQARQHRKYFEAKGVYYLGANSFSRLFHLLTGQISFFEVERKFYEEAKKGSERAGNATLVGYSDSFVAPAYYVTDLDLARNIYVKNFDNFVNKRAFRTERVDILKKMLLSMENEPWKAMRSKLSPTFTTGKIRSMFGIFDESSRKMCDYLRKTIGSTSGGEADICEAFSKYAMDVIASCAFGVDSKSFESKAGVMSEFEEMGQRFQFKFTPSVFLKFMVILIAPKLADWLGIQVFAKEPQEYFTRIIKDVMKHRRKTGERHDDFLQLMMDIQKGLLKDDENSKETLEVMTGSEVMEKTSTNSDHFSATANKVELTFNDDDIVANAVLFLIGGFDMTHAVLTFAAYQLAVEQDVQERLRNEVLAALEKSDGKMTYECVQEMQYLDMFLSETLRFYPPALRLDRVCTKDYQVPATNVVIEKGTLVSLPVIGAHRDPKYYENPEQFDPQRFLPEIKGKRHPYAFSPFGHGPRNCIGMRFALTEIKAVVATLVYNFRLEPCSKTQIPPKFGNNTTLRLVNPVLLKMTPRTEKKE